MARTGVSRPQLGWPVQQTVGEPLRHLDEALAGLAVARASSLPGRHHTDAPRQICVFRSVSAGSRRISHYLLAAASRY